MVCRNLCGWIIQQCRWKIALGRGQPGKAGFIAYFHNGVQESAVPECGFILNAPALIGKIPAQHRRLALTLQDQPILSVFQPGGAAENGDHGISAHAGADQTVKIPGDAADAVAEKEADLIPDTEFFRIYHSAVQRPFSCVSGSSTTHTGSCHTPVATLSTHTSAHGVPS